MISLSKPQKLLLFFFIAVISVVAGARIGRLFQRVGPGLPPELLDEISTGSETPESVSFVEESATEGGGLPQGWESYTGVIREVDEIPKVTHVLIAKDGEEVIFLKSRDQKLKVSEGMEAEVQGSVEPVEGNDLMLMTVERVVFR